MWCHFFQHVCHVSSSVVCCCFWIHSFKFKAFNRAHTQRQTKYLFPAKVIVEYVPQSSAHNASPSRSEKHRLRERPCWDLQWPLSKLAGEPEHANKGRGCGRRWTAGGKGRWEAPAPAPVTTASPCAARRCRPGARSSPAMPRAQSYSSGLPTHQYRSRLLLMTRHLTHACREGRSQAAPRCPSWHACPCAPREASLGARGAGRQPWMYTHTRRRAFAHAAFYPLPIITTGFMAPR